MFSTSAPASRFPRRALLAAPFALAGLAAALYRRERELPSASENGSGPLVELALFSRDGKQQAVLPIHKLLKTDREWRDELTGEEFAVTRRQSTEFAFDNRYWNNHEAGLYRCVCCGTALFRSEDKFDSGTGWPSFSIPLAPTNIYTRSDTSFSMNRTEVLCRKCDAHLGHVFRDGPPPSGLRYCLNSAALRFIRYA
jgi:peptide-methionine (R)-S-oxide reductase